MLYTIGHSTRAIENLIAVLNHYKIELLIDVRHFPMSRHNPQFNKELLEKELPRHGIEYAWLEVLGGFRKGGYKNYTKTKEFKKGIEKLIKFSENKSAAIMCAEITWLKCHRRYIADELKGRKIKVVHIQANQRFACTGETSFHHVYDEKRTEKHRITLRKKIKCD